MIREADIERLYAHCLDLFRTGRQTTYGAVARHLGYEPAFAHSKILWEMLEQVNVLAKQRGETHAISGVVVNADTKLPGTGYLPCAARLGLIPVVRTL